jgi:hypothetical protein
MMLRVLEQRLAMIGLVLVTLFATGLYLFTSLDLARQRYQEDVLQAGLYARALARAVASTPRDAATIRDTVARLSQVLPPPARLAVYDGASKALWTRGTSEGMPVSEVIDVQGERLGTVVVYVAPWAHWRAMWPPLVLIAACVLVILLILREALRQSIRRGPLLRDLASASMVDRLVLQDVSMTVREALRRPHDERASMLGSRALELNEIYFRLRRLIESLIQTEPEADQRTRLERLLKDSHGGARFSTGTPKEVRLSAVEVDIRWLLFAMLTAYAALRWVLMSGADGMGLGAGGLLAMAAGIATAVTMSARAMRGGTPAQYATAGAIALILATFVAWLLSGYQRSPFSLLAGADPWWTVWLQHALRVLDWLALASATVGIVWVVQASQHVAAVARDEGAPSMPQAWIIGAVLGLEVVGALLAFGVVAVGGRTAGLFGVLLMTMLAWLVLIQSQWASPAWEGFHFVRENDHSPATWTRDVSVAWAAVAGAIMAAAMVSIQMDADAPAAVRDPLVLGASLAFGFGALIVAHVTLTLPRLLSILGLTIVAAAAQLAGPLWQAALPAALADTLRLLSFAAMGAGAWAMRRHAWSRPADPRTRLARLSMAEVTSLSGVALFFITGAALGTRLGVYAIWTAIVIGVLVLAGSLLASAPRASAAKEGSHAP